MSKEHLEKIALVASVAVIATGIWFWSTQIMDVIELLTLAYGE